ncbi:MAG TPA: hypothetical protein VMB34_00770 [Acetobacteraceae bacterium]|nr:hypothetical protein [Acetobacteraceae bacterium]
MRRLVWLALALPLAGCGGGKATATLSVTCGENTQLYGAVSIEVPGDLENGHSVLDYPDPVNPGKTGTIEVQPGNRCKITPAVASK